MPTDNYPPVVISQTPITDSEEFYHDEYAGLGNVTLVRANVARNLERAFNDLTAMRKAASVWTREDLAEMYQRTIDERNSADAEVNRLRQGLWDVYTLLGGDTDGDATPKALVSDIVSLVVNEATFVRDEQNATDARITQLETALRAMLRQFSCFETSCVAQDGVVLKAAAQALYGEAAS